MSLNNIINSAGKSIFFILFVAIFKNIGRFKWNYKA